MTHQETLRGRALADKLAAILHAIDEIENRSALRLLGARSEIVVFVGDLADQAATEARTAFLAGFNLGDAS